MGVVVAMVALATWCMDRHVHRHPMPLADLPCEAQRKIAPRLGRQLGGQCDFIFAGDGRVLARLCLLGGVPEQGPVTGPRRSSAEHTSELQSLMRISYAVFCLKIQKLTYQATKNRAII